MARQCVVVAISHRLNAESLASTEKDLYQSKAPVSPLDTTAKKAKCEDLEKVVIGDTPEKFFQVGAQLPL